MGRTRGDKSTAKAGGTRGDKSTAKAGGAPGDKSPAKDRRSAPVHIRGKGTAKNRQCQKDATASGTSRSPPECSKQHCQGNGTPAEFPLAGSPSILLHLLSSCELDPKDLAALEATCKFFRRPANFAPNFALPLPELAAFDMCQKRTMFKTMKPEEKESLKRRCGGSWKLVLGYILIRERNCFPVTAGLGHSIVVTTDGHVYSFGANGSGQLGLGDKEDRFEPSLIRSLQGIRIIQAAAGSRHTILVGDTGSVYTFGKNSFVGADYSVSADCMTTPKVVESLKDVFVVQAAIGGYFSAVLSREGQVYTFSWGKNERLGHLSDHSDVTPRLLSGPIENVLVAQISAGNCYLLMLAYKPSGMSVYSLGCGQGGKLGHGCRTTKRMPVLIEHFQSLKFNPISVAAGTWNSAALGDDGRVCTWGWGNNGSLGHGDEGCRELPTVVEGLSKVKAIHVSTGEYVTYVVADNGDVYSFGYPGYFTDLQEGDELATGLYSLTPKLVASIKALKNEKASRISTTKASYLYGQYGHELVYPHTLAVMESGRVYGLGSGVHGQLGVKLANGEARLQSPVSVPVVDLS